MFESLIGGFVYLSCSLFVPMLVFVVTFWRDMGALKRTALCLGAVAAAVLMVGVTVQDVIEFVQNLS